jgi:hypothetical protein
MKRIASEAGKYAVLAITLGVLIPSVARADQFRCTGPSLAEAAVNPPSLRAIGTINGTNTDISSCIFTNGKVATLSAFIFGGAGSADVHAVLNSDPFITFGATTNKPDYRYGDICILIRNADSSGSLFGSEQVPGGVTVTDGARRNTTVATSAIFPTFISGYGTLGLVPTNLGVNLGTTPCVAAGAPAAVTNTCSYGTASNTFAPTLYDNLEALLTYTQNDLGSVASVVRRRDYWYSHPRSRTVITHACCGRHTPYPRTVCAPATKLERCALSRRLVHFGPLQCASFQA